MIPTNHNPYSTWGSTSSSGSSIYGALPYPNSPPPSNPLPNLATFHITAFDPTILNSQVVGTSNGQVYYTISTDAQMAGYTVVKRVDGQGVALVEWQRHARVEVRGAVQKQDTKDWLKISRDQSYRMMTVRGTQYKWVPENQYINLYSRSSTPQFYGRISRGEGSVVLEVTGDAMQNGLLDAIVTAAVILQCGSNID
ncbi:hypothetical protein HMN09_00217300 [Mycena chlorophos]|uniref:DUF6593 domain-containing protein n=1 Tax=Mycena chlorophos TaxID=658473 RepID=A0A8H6TNB6_MYCCL|nr:hypothetical protein HMN09_00217300 [Mycena chlorophos]